MSSPSFLLPSSSVLSSASPGGGVLSPTPSTAAATCHCLPDDDDDKVERDNTVPVTVATVALRFSKFPEDNDSAPSKLVRAGETLLAGDHIVDLEEFPSRPHLTKQNDLLKEYADQRWSKKTGVRISTKSKIVNITQTLKAIEDKLNSLNYHTSAETILYTTHGSTDLPLRGITFATRGVQHFMHAVMNIDNQYLLSKMEGFAVQGVKGAAKNHQQRVSEVREITGDSDAKMQWAYYFCNIIQRYQVMVDGWPDNIPFANLSKVSSALPELERLLCKWESGLTRWKTLTDDEFEKIHREHNVKLDSGEIEDTI
ncbi:hypothetical protein P692DRAFT_20817536 [Suillus brevipes Sb2]|nr:hypothetical protein P692DRAFT_20817536 [Suillus brevipes Sb2]